MPKPSTTEQLERDVANIPVTDAQHQPDQSLHQQEIFRNDHHDQAQQSNDEDAQSEA